MIHSPLNLEEEPASNNHDKDPSFYRNEISWAVVDVFPDEI